MSKTEYTMEAMGPYTAANGGLPDKEPSSEAKGDRDENDLAVFGKRQQLKVPPLSVSLYTQLH